MRIKRLEFENFRNLADGEIFPDAGINVIYGNNAQGKTNLLEAVWLFTGGHSFRGNKDSELVRIGSEKKETSLHTDFFSETRDQKASLIISRGKRSSVINGIEKKTGTALVGKICAVIFSPEHLLLVKEGPSRRRNFIDAALCQTRPSYVKVLSQYNRSVLQRNALLKAIAKQPSLESTLDVWDDRLVHFGAEVIRERYGYIEKLMPSVEEIYRGISRDKEKISLEYEINCVKNCVKNAVKKSAVNSMVSLMENSPADYSAEIDKTYGEAAEEQAASVITAGFGAESREILTPGALEEILSASLEKNRETDLRLGFTSSGPHKDDINFRLNGVSVRTFASQGQQRSVVLALKLAEAEILEKSIGEPPLILLDDVMSELDSSRQDYLLNHLEGRQVFITCCSPDTVSLMRTGKRIYVENGTVTAESMTQPE